MRDSRAACAFCNAASEQVHVDVVDAKWLRNYGGSPVVVLEHGWHLNVAEPSGDAVQQRGPFYLAAHHRVACDFCAHGWIEDLRWRAEPTLLLLAEGRVPPPKAVIDMHALLRWAQLTAVLAEMVHGLPVASSSAKRQALRGGYLVAPEMPTWFFRPRQRLPARVRASQVRTDDRDASAFLQVISVDVARFTAVMLIASEAEADAHDASARLMTDFGSSWSRGVDGAASVRDFDLAREPHPHRVAVDRLCSAISGGHVGGGHEPPYSHVR